MGRRTIILQLHLNILFFPTARQHRPTRQRKLERNVRITIPVVQEVFARLSAQVRVLRFWHRSGGSNKKTEEEDRIKAEAKKLQEKGRAVQRRDFSFQTGDDSTVVSEERSARREERERRRASRSPTKKIPGSYHAESEVGSNVSSDIGTKSYHHPIPGLGSTAGSEYTEEKRKKRNGGYRRGRSDSLGDGGN